MMSPESLRRCRRVNVGLALFNFGIGAWNASTGSPAAFLSFVVVTAIAVVIARQSYLIRQRTTQLPQRRRLHIGELYLAELPGFLFILLAGPEYWKAAGRILERRAAKPSTPIADAYYQQGKHTARDLMYDLMGPLPGGYGPRRANCMRCGAPHPLVSGHCGPCYEYRLRRRGNPT